MTQFTTGKWAVTCLAVVFCAHLSAQSDHEPLSTSSTLNFATVFEAALRTAPEAPAALARQQLAENFVALGRRWITNRPSWEANYLDDKALDATGLREIEAGVKVDLWRPGERAEARTLGMSYTQKADAWQYYFNLLVAGRVRTVLADIAYAEALLALEQQATREAERLLEITTGLFEAGSAPELDLMQARTLLLAQRKQELEAVALLVDAERDYSVITGLEIRPAENLQESQSSQTELAASHPYLQFLQAEIDLAQATIDKTRREVRGSPSMTLGVKRQRGDGQQPYVDSFGLSFSVPFGGGAAVSAPVSAAHANKVEIEIQYTQAYQLLNNELHEAEHEMFVIEQSLALSREQADISQRHWEMSRTAFEAGETTLLQVVMALQVAQSSTREYELLLLEKQRKISEYNQAVGVLP